MAVSEFEHLSIFINANQFNKQAVNHKGWAPNSLFNLVPQHRSHNAMLCHSIFNYKLNK
jgi:hypothetical protein